MTSEQFINKYGETFFKAEKLGSFYNDVHKLISCHVEKVESLESQLKEVSKDHAKTLQLLSDVISGKVEFKRQTVKNRIKKYIDAHRKELI